MFVLCSETEMNNPYQQFTVQPRCNARFWANASNNNLNFHNPALATVRLLSPSVARANQQMYNAFYSNTPVAAVSGTPGFSTVGVTPLYVTNSQFPPTHMPVMPVISVDLGNQHFRACHPTNLQQFPDAVDLLGQRMTENTAVLPNQISALPAQTVFARQTHDVPTLLQAPVLQSSVGSTANMLSGDAHTPFREVQWIPPGVQQTGLPQIPYAVEIKPQNDETQQNHVPFGNLATIDSVVQADDAHCKMEGGNDQSVPTVYLDIATDTDSSTYCLDSNIRMADVPSIVGEISVVNANKETVRRKRGQLKNDSGAKVLKLHDKNVAKPNAVSLPALASRPTVVMNDFSESNDSAEELYVADDDDFSESTDSAEELYVVDDDELNEPGVDVLLAAVQQKGQELLNSRDAPVSPSTLSSASEPGELIRSDEDIGDGEELHDDDTCSQNDGVNTEKTECYDVVSMNSDALLFDMECDGGKEGETLRVIEPTKNVETAIGTESVKTAAAQSAVANTPSSSTRKSKQSQKPPTTSHSSIVSLLLDDDDDDSDVVVVESSRTAAVTRSQRLAVRAAKKLQTVTLKNSENSIVGIPLQSSFFRYETKSSEVFRLLSMEKSFVPRNVLTVLTDLWLANETADDKECLHSDSTSGTGTCMSSSIPQGGSRKLLFQCLFCPYGELSAKRVMGHVKQQHRKYASFIQRTLLPNCQTLLHIYCRHCNFVTYDTAALFVHFATYHKVAGILLSEPKVIETDPSWAPMIFLEDKAREFPFFCCPDCGYVDIERNRIAQHILQKPSSESVFLGCVVRLIMIVRGSKPLGTYSYARLTTDQSHAMFRKEIYACVSCRFFSFYPTYAFSHYVVSHTGLEVLYTCASSPSCAKRCTNREEIIAHILGVHVAMKSLRYQCTATLLDRSTSAQLDIGPGELTAADVPAHFQYRSSSPAAGSTSSAAPIEIVDDDDADNESDNDVVILGSPHDHNTSIDVEPDSPLSKEHTDVPTDTEPSCSPIMIEEDVSEQKQSELSIGSTELQLTATVAEQCAEENIEPDVIHSVENDDSTLKASHATCDTIDSVCSDEDQSAVEPDHCQSNKAAPNSNMVEAESLVECDLESGQTEQPISEAVSQEEIDKTQSQLVENTVNLNSPGTSHAEPVNSTFDSSFPSMDTSPLAGSTAVDTEMVNDTDVPSNDEISTELESEQSLVPETSHKESDVECSTSSGKDTSQLVDVSISADHADKSPESESAENPFPRTRHVESDNCGHDLSFPNDNMNQPLECASVASDSVSDVAGVPVSSEVHQSDELQGREHDRSVSEVDTRGPQPNSASTAEQELFTLDAPNSVDLFDCLADDDLLPGFELCKSLADPLESSEPCSLNLEDDLLLMAGQLAADEPQSGKVEHAVAARSVVCDISDIVSIENPCLGPCQESPDDAFNSSAGGNEQLQISGKSLSQEADVIDNSLQEHFTQTSVLSSGNYGSEIPSESRDLKASAEGDSMNEQCIVSDSSSQPVSRFRSLAGFRFPAPHLFTAKPS